MSRQARRREAEERACAYLKSRDLRLVARNYRYRVGEIDLNTREDSILLFVQMRLRRNARVGGVLTRVDHRKRSRLIASA